MTRLFVSLCATLLACAAGAQETSKPSKLPAADVQVELRKLESLLTDGPAPMQVLLAREFSVTEGARDARVVAVLFNMSGYDMGNGSVTYLAVFERNTERPSGGFAFHVVQLRALLAVGARGEREFDAMQLHGHRITLTGKGSAGPVTAVFEFGDYSLKEVGLKEVGLKEVGPTEIGAEKR